MNRGVGYGSGRPGYKPDPLRIGIAVSLLVSVGRIHEQLGFLAALRPGLLVTVFLVGYTLAVPSSVSWRLLSRSRVTKPLAGLAILACLSVPFGLSIGQSASFILDVYSRVLLFALILLVSLRTITELRFAVWCYLGAVGALMFFAIAFGDMSSVHGGIDRLQGDSMYDANDLGVLLMVALPLGLLTLETSSTWRGKAASIAILAAIGYTMALTGSRGGMVGLAFVAVGVLLLVRHVSIPKKVLSLAAVVAALTVAAPPGYWQQMETIIRPDDDYNLTDPHGRKALATRGLGYMAAYPVFGLGISNFGRAELEISPLLTEYAPGTIAIRNLAPHNTYVEVGTEMGVFALAIWLALLGAGIFGLRRMSRRVPKEWASDKGDRMFLQRMLIYLPISFLAFAVTSFFVSHAYLPSFYVLVVLMGALDYHVRRLLLRTGPEGPGFRSSPTFHATGPGSPSRRGWT